MNYVLLALGILLCLPARGRQAPEQSVPAISSLPDKAFRKIDCESEGASLRMQQQTQRYLRRLQKLETKMYRKLWRKDSVLANQLFSNTTADYAQLQQPALTDAFHSVYSSGLDSVTTALRFIQTQLPVPDPRIAQSFRGGELVQAQLNVSGQVTSFMQQRQQLLQQQLQQVGLVRELQQFHKQCYYYKAQMQQYREMLNNPQLLQNAVLTTVKQLPAFRSFFAQHSQLAALFAVPSPDNTSSEVAPGLQTISMVTDNLQSRFGSMEVVNQAIQQNLPPVENRLQQAQNQLTGYTSGSYGNGSADMPSFQPNSQKTKTWWQRITLGMNIQSQKASYYFPDTTIYAYERYNDYLALQKETVTSNYRASQQRSYKYAFTASSAFSLGLNAGEQTMKATLLNQHYLLPLEVVDSIKPAGSSLVFQQGSRYVFSSFNDGRVFLAKWQGYTSATDYNEINFSAYDQWGNLTEKYKTGGAKEVILWGYKGLYPVARVTGSNYATVSGLVNAATLNNPASDAALRSELNNIRTGLASTMTGIATYTYVPGYGMSSVVDASGKAMYYEFDAMGRLKLIRDKDNRILKKNQYTIINNNNPF